jgi:hypothetical protein
MELDSDFVMDLNKTLVCAVTSPSLNSMPESSEHRKCTKRVPSASCFSGASHEISLQNLAHDYYRARKVLWATLTVRSMARR